MDFKKFAEEAGFNLEGVKRTEVCSNSGEFAHVFTQSVEDADLNTLVKKLEKDGYKVDLSNPTVDKYELPLNEQVFEFETVTYNLLKGENVAGTVHQVIDSNKMTTFALIEGENKHLYTFDQEGNVIKTKSSEDDIEPQYDWYGGCKMVCSRVCNAGLVMTMAGCIEAC
ncbi:MAG: hypothetical protein LBV11_22080, partial [Bacillus cereus]|nr:hypothetical protein [Bacillus cereus]